MIRFLVIALLVIAVWFLLLKLSRALKSASIDWTAVAAIAGFVAMAFYLRHVTGWGWLGAPFL